MARKTVQSQQAHINQHDERAYAHTEVSVPVEGIDRVVPEEAKEYQRKKKCVAVQVLQDERECGLALVLVVAAFIHRARGRIQEECAVISLTVVVAGSAEAQR